MKLTSDGCKERQRRLLAILQERDLDGAIISDRKHVYYFTGFLHHRLNAAAAFIRADGHTSLVGASQIEGQTDAPAADQIIPYDADFYATIHSRQFETVAERLAPVLPANGSLGADHGGGISCINNLAEAVDITRDVFRLRKCKLPDEVEAIRDCIRVVESMYAAAKEHVRPGIDEVDVLAELRAAATRTADEDLETLGNDFRANAAGGLARRRPMQAGELYVLDAGTVYDGYFSDSCRTFAVDRSPTDAQMKAWEYIDALFPTLESAARPGLKGTELFEIADGYLSQNGYSGLVHHLGHGFGLGPHETPELNPEYDAVLEVGDVITMEPGLYNEELKAGIRLEEDYYLSEDGLIKLTSFPRDLI